MKSGFSPNDKQLDFYLSNERLCAFVGGWGSGKSFIARHALLEKHISVPGNEILIGRMTYRELEDSVIPDFFQAFPDLRRFYNKGKMKIELRNGTQVHFRHLEEPHKLSNMNLGAVWIEQAEEIPEDSALMLIGRLRREVPCPQLLMTANTYGQNWLYAWFKQGKSPLPFKLVEATTLDNKENLPKEYLTSLDALKKTRPNVYNRYVMNSWASVEGAVWPEFTEARHVINPFPIPPSWRQGICVDHGYRNPTAILWWAIDQDGVVYIYDEHYEGGQVIKHHATCVKRRAPHTWQDALCDPSLFNKGQESGSSIVSVADKYAEHGIYLRPAPRKADADMAAVVGEWFALDKIRIFKNCYNMIREARDLQWQKARQAYLEKHAPPERIQDRNDHCTDDLIYIISDRPMPNSSVMDQLSIMQRIKRVKDYEEAERPYSGTIAGL